MYLPIYNRVVARFFFVQHTKTGKIYQMTIKYTKWPQKYKMAVGYTKWPKNIPTSSIERPYKIYPHWNFWFEIIPFGNPDLHEWE
jgi:hypothetical protein